ncbi:MAG: hypothetical protein N2C14_14705 [Planctomycetales bacterium]
MTSTASDAEIQQWVHQLINYRTRRDARRKLVEAKAIPALIEALKSPNESVAWAAVASLQELRAREAVGGLIDLLERGVLPTDATDALEDISGEKFALDVGAWRAWDRTGSAAAGRRAAGGGDGSSDATAPAEPLTRDELIRQSAEILEVEPTGAGDSREFHLDVPGDRKQRVTVHFGNQDEDGDELVVVYSPCCPADSKYYEASLRMNLTLPAGALAIRDVDDVPTLVMVDVFLAATLHPWQLAKSITYIAERADKLEQRVTGQDVH